LNNKIFMDTGFVMAVVNDKDQYHPDAVKLANRFRNYPTVITDAVLLEIGNSLARNFKGRAIDIINHFYSSKEVILIHVTPALLRRGFELYRTFLDKSWGLVDCVSFVVMQDLKIMEVLTFDRHFAQAGFKILAP